MSTSQVAGIGYVKPEFFQVAGLETVAAPRIRSRRLSVEQTDKLLILSLSLIMAYTMLPTKIRHPLLKSRLVAQ